jgi:hypothetical protein
VTLGSNGRKHASAAGKTQPMCPRARGRTG